MIFLPILTVLAAIGGVKAFSPGYLLAPIRKRINKSKVYKVFYPVTECDICGSGSFYNILTVLIVATVYPIPYIPLVIVLNGLVSMGLMTVLNKHL